MDPIYSPIIPSIIRTTPLKKRLTAIIDAQGTVVAAAQPLEEDFIVADVSLQGLAGGMDGDLFGRANQAVREQFLALWS